MSEEIETKLPVGQPRLVLRLREACNGHPAAKIPWPHRVLHEAAERIEAFEAAARSLVEAWDEDEIGQVDGELIDGLRDLLPENAEVWDGDPKAPPSR